MKLLLLQTLKLIEIFLCKFYVLARACVCVCVCYCDCDFRLTFFIMIAESFINKTKSDTVSVCHRGQKIEK